MSGSTKFVTCVYRSLGGWQWTVPRPTRERSIGSAENMVGAWLLEDKGISSSFSNFGIRLRQKYPEIVKESRKHIGETRKVVVEAGMKPKEFQRKFHEVRCKYVDIY